MANGFSDLLGRIASPFYAGRDLDEEERRLMEELRAKGMYVPQERRIAPFGYGSGRRRREDLTDIRTAIKPEQQRKTNELMWQRSEAARQAAAVEAFNRKQGFDKQLMDQDRARRIALEQRRQALMGKSAQESKEMEDYRKRVAEDRTGMYSDFDKNLGAGYFKKHIATKRMSPEERAELPVLQREITPALTQTETLKQQQQKTAVGQIDVETKTRANDLAKQVHSFLPSDYARDVADDQVLGLELKTLLNVHRLGVQRAIGEDLMQTEADAHMATKKQEIRAIESLESWLVNTPEGLEFMRLGGPQREEQRLKLGQLKVMLLQAEARKLEAENYRQRRTPTFDPFEPLGRGRGNSGWDPSRPTFNWGNTNAPPVTPQP